MNDNDDDDQVGYGRPPKKHQFKKGQSGCANGGHDRRKAKLKARAKAEEEENKKKDKELQDLIRKIGREEVTVHTKTGSRLISKAEATVRLVLERALSKGATERQIQQALKLYQHAKMLDPKPSGPRPSVLVVPPPMTIEEWAKRTEGELLPKNPLEGIPGAEGFLDAKIPRGTPPEDDDEAA